MASPQQPTENFFQQEIRLLFYQRTMICLWLAVVFFSLFSLLDYIYCREFFTTFLLYRLTYVITILSFIHLLKIPVFKQHVYTFMFVAMILGGFTISLMTVSLGGFLSGYYVGILLMIAGALSVLPLRAGQAIFTGVSMYLVYVATILIGTGNIDNSQLAYAANNSFFFFSLVGVAAIQSYDDLATLSKSLRAKQSIQTIRKKLSAYTNGLEEKVQQRLADLQETDLKFRDLYDNILDLVILINDKGDIQQFNRHWTSTLGFPKEKLQQENIKNILCYGNQNSDWLSHIILQLNGDYTVQGIQLSLTNDWGKALEVELRASRVEIETNCYYQLVLRDITATKAIETKLLDSERLIGTSRQAAIFGLARLAECRDDDTGSHLSRIRSYTLILAEELARSPDFAPLITEQFIEEIGYSAVLHDIGKVGIPDSILLKPGKLSQEEFELMKKHTIFGSDVLASAEQQTDSLSFLHIGQEIARSHHERWDARGYPDGLPGEKIPLAARIISLADVYDALTSNRVYKPPFSHEESKKVITEESGKQFDPRIVNAFLLREGDFKEARMKMLLQQEPKEERT